MEHPAYENLKIGDIVTANFNTASVFKEVGIDFCCGGNVTLSEACRNNNLNLTEIKEKLKSVSEIPVDESHNYQNWNLDFLCDYIVNTHHKTIYRLSPQILAYGAKIAEVHGSNHPELKEISQLFIPLDQELQQHLTAEEQVLFPAIKKLLTEPSDVERALIRSEISRMNHEHEIAGSTMDRINKLSSNYKLPEDACNTYSLTYKLLDQFESDLHIHVHIENNILYPRALLL